MKLPPELDPSSVVVLIDTREQTPLDLSPLRTIRQGLTTGDYSLVGFESRVAIERKSLGDLVACVGRERKRFDKEIQRLRAFECKCLVIQSSWGEIEMGQWLGRITPTQVIGSLLSWQAQGLPIMLCGNHERAGRMVSRLLFTYARHRYRELRAILKTQSTPVPQAQETTTK